MKTVSILFLAITLWYPTLAQQADSTTKTNSKELETVIIKSKTTSIRQEDDRIIYDLLADPQSKTSTVLEIIRKVPYLSVDQDDNILLKGSTNYKVLINGRSTGMASSNLKDILRAMPASIIKNIEVITNPPAKYDAEGMAGIINIITNKQSFNGYRGTANVYEKSPAGGPGGGASFTFKRSTLGISAMAGANRYTTPQTTGELNQTTYGSKPTNAYQYYTSKTDKHTAYAGVELSYEPDSLNLLSAECSWSSNQSTGMSAQSSKINSTNSSAQYQLENNSRSANTSLDAAINYQRGFKKAKDRLIILSYQYLQNGNDASNDIVFTNRVNYELPNLRQYNDESYKEHIAMADYAQPIKNLTIECGIKSIMRMNESRFQYRDQDTATGEYKTDEVRSNTFDNSRTILSAYSSGTYKAGAWRLKAGVRAEETIITLYTADATTPLHQQYLNILPGGNLSRKLGNSSSLSFSFSTRIQRPTATELNPFIDRSNPNFISSGNPYLQPITSRVYELSYLRSAKGTISIALGGMFFNNVFSAFPSYDAATDITLTRYENYGSGRVLKTNIYLNYPITKSLTFTLNTDIRHVRVYGSSGSTAVKNSGFNVYVFASGGYSFDKGWRADADITYNMGGIAVPLGKTNGFVATSFSVSKSILSKLSVSAGVSNPFTKYRYTRETIITGDFSKTATSQVYYRRFSISANYRFGKLKGDIRKSKRRDEF